MSMITTEYDTADERRAAVRVPLDTADSLFGRLMSWYSRRTYGDVLDNGLAMLHNRRVLMSVLRFERSVQKWDRLDPDLKTLAEMASAAKIGCSWCMDFGYYLSHSKGLDTSKLEEVPRWRDSDVFTGQERRVLEYAEAVTATPPGVSDDDHYPSGAEAQVSSFVQDRASEQDVALLWRLHELWPANTIEEARSALTSMETGDPVSFAYLRELVYHGYYSSRRVLAAMADRGYAYHGAPQPLGYRITDTMRLPTTPRGSYVATHEVTRVAH